MFTSIPADEIRFAQTITCDFFLFGATGDLAGRKIIPSLYHLYARGKVTPESRLVAISRSGFDGGLESVFSGFKPHVQDLDESVWQEFLKLWVDLKLDAKNEADFSVLAQSFYHPHRIQVAYLATAPDLFIPICQNLAKVGLNHANMRVVLEKPLGHDLASHQEINQAINQVLPEEQVFRIDHYLGKESVQNLLAIRFGNSLFEPLWRREYISNVTITVAETLGVEGRAAYYDQTGALRDMVQNHLMQLLCFVAMEVPGGLTGSFLRQEKLKVVQALRQMSVNEVPQYVVRGQYGSGSLNDEYAKAYTDEEGVPNRSQCETFVALKVFIDNWRWQGVPFFLRTGKRMQAQLAEIVINFRDVPHALIDMPILGSPNQLIIQLQPNESIELKLMCKQDGEVLALEPVTLSLKPRTRKADSVDAYERLLWDVIRGRLGLFMHSAEQVAAWQFLSPILEAFSSNILPLYDYDSGSWGPKKANDLLSDAGAAWPEMWSSTGE